MELKQTLIQVFIFILVIGILIFCTLVILNQYSPFKQCENKPDNYTFIFQDHVYNCGELKAVNTTSNVIN